MIPRSFSLVKSSTARIRTTRFTISQKDQGLRQLPKAFDTSATKTITRSMLPNGSSMMRSTLIAKRWYAREKRTEILDNFNHSLSARQQANAGEMNVD